MSDKCMHADCKVCGKKLSSYITKQKLESEVYVKEAMEKLKEKTCLDLLETYQTSIMFDDYKAAEKLLLERGHKLAEFKEMLGNG